MSGPYFQKQSWGSFTYKSDTYDLKHLDEHVIETNDTDGIARRIAVTSSDHCFTKVAADGDDPALRYPRCSRSNGYFCIERYNLSLGLAEHITHAVNGRVWIIRDAAFAVVPTVNYRGARVLYGIVFSLGPVKGVPVHLHMRVETAYPCNETDIVTYGQVRFSNLIKLRMQRKNPHRIMSENRRRPRPE